VHDAGWWDPFAANLFWIPPTQTAAACSINTWPRPNTPIILPIALTFLHSIIFSVHPRSVAAFSFCWYSLFALSTAQTSTQQPSPKRKKFRREEHSARSCCVREGAARCGALWLTSDPDSLLFSLLPCTHSSPCGIVRVVSRSHEWVGSVDANHHGMYEELILSLIGWYNAKVRRDLFLIRVCWHEIKNKCWNHV
jgi:hypothetical protein